jgi:hypothetical protein
LKAQPFPFWPANPPFRKDEKEALESAARFHPIDFAMERQGTAEDLLRRSPLVKRELAAYCTVMATVVEDLMLELAESVPVTVKV